MALSTTQQTDVFRLTQSMFNAAPGGYMGYFDSYLSGPGTTVTGLSRDLASSDLFTSSSFYPTSLTNSQFSDRLITNLVGSTVSIDNHNWAVSTLTGMLNSGQNRGEVALTAAGALSTLTTTSGWEAAAAQFNNRIEVSRYYTLDRGGTATDLASLQALTASVTDSANSVLATKAILATTLDGMQGMLNVMTTRYVGSQFAISSSTGSQAEGDSPFSAPSYTFTVTRTGSLAYDATVHWAVEGSGDHPADSSDFAYGVLSSGDLTFAAGEAGKTIEVMAAGGSDAEADETFSVALSRPSIGAGLANGYASADGVIDDDDTVAVEQGSGLSGQSISLVSSTTGGIQGGESASPAISADGHYVVFYGGEGVTSAGYAWEPEIFSKDTITGSLSLVSTTREGAIGNDQYKEFFSDVDNYFRDPSVSSDGRYVAFTGNGSMYYNWKDFVFVNDTLTGAITLASCEPDGRVVDGDSFNPSISADGSHVAFSYTAFGVDYIVIKDVNTGSLTVVSCAADGTPGNQSSHAPSISVDGRYVAFESFASNLVVGDSNYYTDIFVKDTHAGTITLVSRASDGTIGNGDCDSPSISADGRYVAFSSLASNLVAGDTNHNPDIFVKDTYTGTITLVSRATDGTIGNGNSDNPTISADGCYVAFESAARNLVAGDTNQAYDIFVKDTRTGAITLVSHAADGIFGNESSHNPSISADGSHVAFESDASNLMVGDTNGYTDIFVARLDGVSTDVTALPPSALNPVTYDTFSHEMARFANAAYSDLVFTAAGVNVPSAGWQPVSLNSMATAGVFQSAAENNPTTSPYANDAGVASAQVYEGLVDGKRTLILAFRGTDNHTEDERDYFPNFTHHYDRFDPLISEVDAYVAAQGINQVYVTGHSLGGAVAQMYMDTHQDIGGVSYEAATFGSPGALSLLNSDSRVIHFNHTNDPVSGSRDLPANTLVDVLLDGLDLATSETPVYNRLVELLQTAKDTYYPNGLGDANRYSGSRVGIERPDIGIDASNLVLGEHAMGNYLESLQLLSDVDSLIPDWSVLEASLNNPEEYRLYRGSSAGDAIHGDDGTLTGIRSYINFSDPDKKDILFGRGGDDTIYGGGNNDILVGDYITIPAGDAPSNGLYASGNDTLEGGNGDDVLIGTMGADLLVGGRGADQFVYNTPWEGSDTISDFSSSEGDRVVFKAVNFGNFSAVALTAGTNWTLAAGNFAPGTPTDGNDFLVFDPVSHVLSYYAEGNQSDVHYALATLSGISALSASDIWLV